jgi:hypothetical protein
MNHLSPDQLIDIVEGAAAEPAHLQSCAVCRGQLNELQAVMSMAAAVNVPEPSPLYWNHLSSRVHEAVAAEGAPRAAAWMWWFTLAAGVVAAVVVAVGISVYRPAVPVTGPEVAGVSVADERQSADAGEATLSMMADLTPDIDLETSREAGLAALTNHVGGADDAVGMLTEGERAELQRLLKEALAKPGA